MFDWNNDPGVLGIQPAESRIRNSPKVRRSATSPSRIPVADDQLARRVHDGLSVLGGYTLSKSTDNGSGIRTLRRRHALPAGQLLPQLRAWVVDLRRAPSVRLVDPLRAAVRPGEAIPAKRRWRRDPRRLAAQHDHHHIEQIARETCSAAPTGRTPAAARTVQTPPDKKWSCRATSARFSAGSTRMPTGRCSRSAPGATWDGTQ